MPGFEELERSVSETEADPPKSIWDKIKVPSPLMPFFILNVATMFIIGALAVYIYTELNWESLILIISGVFIMALSVIMRNHGEAKRAMAERMRRERMNRELESIIPRVDDLASVREFIDRETLSSMRVVTSTISPQQLAMQDNDPPEEETPLKSPEVEPNGVEKPTIRKVRFKK